MTIPDTEVFEERKLEEKKTMSESQKKGIWIILVKPLSKIKHKDPFIHENRYFDDYDTMYDCMMKIDKFQLYGKRNSRDVIGMQLTKGSLKDVEL